MNKSRILEINDYLCEFKADLNKQCVMLMGLPAAGKSTFINSRSLSKYITRMKNYKVTNSDVQLKGMQYTIAKQHYDYIKANVKNENDLRDFALSTLYKNPWNGREIMVPITWAWWNAQGGDGLKSYFDKFFKVYYASYFDVREFAIAAEEDLFKLKIKEAGDMLIIDTTGSNVSKAENRFTIAHKEGYTTTVVYLKVDPKTCIARDEFRRKNSGRGVGESVIMGYAKKIDSAIPKYIKELKTPDGFVDRVLEFEWTGEADPKSGTFRLVRDSKRKN